MKRTLIRVTEDHIAKGISGSLTSCPIALAIIEKTNKPASVATNVWFPGGRIYHITQTSHLSRRVRQFIRRFDGHKSVKPFRFYLMVPQ